MRAPAARPLSGHRRSPPDRAGARPGERCPTRTAAGISKWISVPGSRVEYHMTAPAGDELHGYWDVLAVFRDGFANADGTPNTDMPVTTIRVGIEEVARGRTGMSIECVFPSAEAMEQILATGFDEGLSEGVGQIDAILAEEAIQPRSEAKPL